MNLRKYEFNKLIRSKIPPRMTEEGVRVNKTELSLEDFADQLKVKLLEEAQEVIDAKDKQQLIVELADVTEVIKAIAQVHGITEEEIENERLKKLEINGSFEKENYINFIEVEESNKVVIDYLENKDRPYKLEQS